MTEFVLEARQRLACRLARHLSRRGAGRSTRPASRWSPQAPRPSRASSPRASRSTASTPASESSPACASPAADLETLQRNIVLSPCRRRRRADAASPIARLMMALKLASLAQGASGVRPETLELLEAMLAQRRHPGRPGARLGRRLRRPRAAGAHDGGDDRRRRVLRRRRPHAGGGGASRRPGSSRSSLGAKEGLALLNGTQFSTAYALAGAVRGRTCCSSRRWSPARCRPTRRRAPTRRSIRASMRCAAIAARSRRPTRCAR